MLRRRHSAPAILAFVVMSMAVGACQTDATGTTDTPDTTTATTESTSSPGTTPTGDAAPTGGATSTGEAPGSTGAGPDLGTPAHEPDDAWSLALAGPVGTQVPTTPGAVLDDSGDARLDATAASGLIFVAGHPRGAVGVAFMGTGTGLQVSDPDVADLDLAAGDSFTLELGFRTDVHGQDGTAGSAVLFERAGSHGLAIVDGRLVFTAGAASLVLAEPAVNDGRWHRAVATRDVENDRLTLTLDGAYTAQLPDPTAGQPLTGAPTLSVGARPDGTGALLGEVDHIRWFRHTSVPFTVTTIGAGVTVFKGASEPVPEGGTYHSVRIPAIVRSSDGSLVAFAEGRVDAECDFGNIDAVLKRSTDGGQTWSKISRVANNGKGKVGNVIPFFDAVRDRLVVLTSHTDIEGGACSDPVAGSGRVQVQHSSDHGVTWTEPADVTDQVTDPAWHPGGLIGPSHGIQLHHADNAGDLVVHAMHRRLSDNRRGGHLLVSHDGGESWVISTQENTSAPTVQVNESTVAELTDGRLYVNVRHQVADPVPEQSEGLRGHGLVGADLEYVATPPFARTATFRGPVVHGTTLRWPGSDRHGDAARVLFSYPAGESGTNFGQRRDLRVYVSDDDAASFTPGVRVFAGKASYSDLVALADSQLGVLFETARDDEDFNTRVDFRGFALQQLDDPTVLAWTFEDGAVGQAVAQTKTPGLTAVPLVGEGAIVRVAGRHHSAAVRLDGTRLCASSKALGHLADLDVRDGFEVEVTFRSDAHVDGGSQAAGTLIAKTAVGTSSAWWLRVEDGRLRFAVGDELGDLDIVASAVKVSDGVYHTVRARRDVLHGHLAISVDGEAPVTMKLSAKGLVRNDEPLCIGAFAGAGTPRAFIGDIDAVAVRLLD